MAYSSHKFSDGILLLDDYEGHHKYHPAHWSLLTQEKKLVVWGYRYGLASSRL